MPRKTQLYESYFPPAQRHLKLPKVVAGTAEVWDACLSTMTTERTYSSYIAVSPCSPMMAYNDKETIVVRNLETRAVVATLDVNKYSSITALQFLTDGRLRAGFDCGNLATWGADLVLGSQCEEGHTMTDDDVVSLSPNGAYAATRSYRHLRVWAVTARGDEADLMSTGIRKLRAIEVMCLDGSFDACCSFPPTGSHIAAIEYKKHCKSAIIHKLDGYGLSTRASPAGQSPPSVASTQSCGLPHAISLYSIIVANFHPSQRTEFSNGLSHS